MYDDPSWHAAFLELEAVAAADPLSLFVPSPALHEFMGCTSRLILIRAANQIGKTYQVCARLAKEMVANPGKNYRVSGASSKQTHSVMGGYLWKFLRRHVQPGSYFTPGRGWNNAMIVLRNGTTCELKSGEDHPQTHAGGVFDGVVLDEVPKPAILVEAMTRVSSRRGFVWVAMTPVDRPVQYFRDIVEKEGSRWKQFVVEYCRENCPWLGVEQAQEHIDNMADAPWHYEQRIKGAWDGVTLDRLFTGLSDANVSAVRVVGEWRIGLAMDHGEQAGRQVAILFLYRDVREGGRTLVQVHALDEYVSTSATDVSEDAAGMIAMLKRHNIEPDEVDVAVGDTNAGKAYSGQKINRVLEESFALQLHVPACPFRIRDAHKSDAMFALHVVNWMLRRNELTVHPRCVTLLKTLRHWQGKSTGTDGELKHMADTLRYFCAHVTKRHAPYQKLRVNR